MLWKEVFELEVEIYFAYPSFKWSNNAKNNAAVTCVIIGLSSKKHSPNKYLFNEEMKEKVDSINAYLTKGATEIIGKKSNRICKEVPKMVYGNKATDNGNLILSEEEAKNFAMRYPDLADLIHPYVGSMEFLRDIKRYCFYITEKDYEKADKNTILHERFEAIRNFRLASSEKATRDTAKRPFSFFFDSYNGSESIIVPRVSSERREYIPIGFQTKDVVISDSANAVYDAESWLFAILTSKMHNIWVRAVGGALETRIRYSATLCYNTFPFPKIGEVQKAELEELAQNVLDIREEHFDMTLGEMYTPESMPDDLREAHHRLDLAVERCYRPEPFASDEERLEYLFKLYVKMTKSK